MKGHLNSIVEGIDVFKKETLKEPYVIAMNSATMKVIAKEVSRVIGEDLGEKPDTLFGMLAVVDNKCPKNKMYLFSEEDWIRALDSIKVTII